MAAVWDSLLWRMNSKQAPDAKLSALPKLLLALLHQNILQSEHASPIVVGISHAGGPAGSTGSSIRRSYHAPVPIVLYPTPHDSFDELTEIVNQELELALRHKSLSVAEISNCFESAGITRDRIFDIVIMFDNLGEGPSGYGKPGSGTYSKFSCAGMAPLSLCVLNDPDTGIAIESFFDKHHFDRDFVFDLLNDIPDRVSELMLSLN